MPEIEFQCQRCGVSVRSYAYWNYRTIPPTLLGAGPHCMYCQEGKNIVTRNTEMVKGTDIVDWLREQRDEEATARQKLFRGIQGRAEAVKAGRLKPEDVIEDDQFDTKLANVHDALALRYFTALEEIERSRKIIAEMTKSLRERGCYEEGR